MIGWDVSIICTGNGTHKVRQLAKIQDRRQANADMGDMIALLAPHVDQSAPRPDVALEPRRRSSATVSLNGKGERFWQFRCPTCKREEHGSDRRLVLPFLDLAEDRPDLGDRFLDISLWRL